ncbi:hypothetical protein [Nitrolancea hollandica]|uniref:CHRD domain-containing protein n=1 Tax=Nitrolancea hollandica Lb TaxID=1129897 RepID=I4EET0_9BACT|nr:hypothetical protein [Nitrolancea hollandica]CCF83192.1 exported hypothetical protein [Nitrolancea hollandica Lb]
MRRRVRMLWTCVLLVVLVAAMFPAVTSAAPAEKTKSFTIISSGQVPLLNIGVGGTLTGTFSGTQDSFAIDWTFRGFSGGGGPATASGTGTGSWDPSSHTLSLSLTGISSWDIPGFPQPQVGSATVTRLGPDLVSVSVGDIVSGIPMVVTPPFGNPFNNPFQFWTATAIGTGSVNLDALPGARAQR